MPSRLSYSYQMQVTNDFHPNALLNTVKSRVPRSIINENQGGDHSRSTSIVEKKDPILSELTRLQVHEPELTIKATYDDDMVEYSANLQELLYLLVEEKEMDDHIRMNIEQSLADIISYLPNVEEETPEELPKFKKDTSYKFKQNIPKPKKPSTMTYPNSYLSKILIDNFELLLKFSSTYFNLSLSSKVTKYIVELIYQLNYWEIVHLSHSKDEKFLNFLRLVGFEVIDTLFGFIIKPPENYLNDSMLQGLQYPWPYPFYNYSYHSFNSRVEDEKLKNVKINPYIDIRLKKSPILSDKNRSRKVRKLLMREEDDDLIRETRRKLSSTASLIDNEESGERDSVTPSIMDVEDDETDDHDLSKTMSDSESLDDDEDNDDEENDETLNKFKSSKIENDQTEDEIDEDNEDDDYNDIDDEDFFDRKKSIEKRPLPPKVGSSTNNDPNSDFLKPQKFANTIPQGAFKIASSTQNEKSISTDLSQKKKEVTAKPQKPKNPTTKPKAKKKTEVESESSSKQIPAEHFINGFGSSRVLFDPDTHENSLQNLRIDETNPDYLITEKGKRIPRTGIIHQCQLIDPNTNFKCYKVFYGRNELLRHQEFVHATKKKIYKCIYCLQTGLKIQSYPRHDSLARHIRRKHGITGKENKQAVNYAKENCDIIDDIRFPIFNDIVTPSTEALQPGEIPLSETQKISLTLGRKRNHGNAKGPRKKKESTNDQPVEGSSSSISPQAKSVNTEEDNDSDGVKLKKQKSQELKRPNETLLYSGVNKPGRSGRNYIVMNINADDIDPTKTPEPSKRPKKNLTDSTKTPDTLNKSNKNQQPSPDQQQILQQKLEKELFTRVNKLPNLSNFNQSSTSKNQPFSIHMGPNSTNQLSTNVSQSRRNSSIDSTSKKVDD
ncbi:hypothetical protein KGF54_004807 [Candida jiufengensis]|uniref:uncharacterized protein n=1 Tax=Candida jiufengensis TaxID=497108 RepID=UPI0022255464|nr:uncharacterized protein KGF54_004807 [Candida jiufengensis]KAI5951732.1 hypothetical protein KGF54_004807 [Candida jiufengensis]